jgi:hypothetical protein
MILFNYYYYLLLWRQPPHSYSLSAGSSIPFTVVVAEEAVGLGAKIVESEVTF